ncbi:asparaginase-domain-containing protein [Suillus subalutaceus]|uniref:asparaginase-domain-containing protein n=1 Tax=Suillus subalutaceus TaxID=48586 RepID=UPI001B878B42|nr:asparaginase-domain-containing protein [Suillus subalutaceus]KAG1867150.1 asparaginase-domain-containing protein [Suillus subalutaceus]
MMETRSDEARVLVIYTGGTIGMLVSSRGYVPEPYFLTDTLRSQKRFHDPLQDSLFSNAASVEGYREWSNSGKSTPVNSDDVTTPGALNQPTLLVRSSRPIGSTSTLSPSISSQIQKVIEQPECINVADGVYETRLPSLVTPRSVVPGHGHTKRIRYAILEWNPLLDSSNMEMDDWIRIAAEIELNYTSFDAFVILHGTDTMSYTSSALSFLLEDLGKTVILTGAQIPLSQLRNDAVDNLLGALSIAGNYIIPECSLYFNHTLYRGNRVSKASSYDLNAFHSPNFPPLVNVGIDIVVNWNDVLRQTSLRRFRAYKDMSPHVATLRLFPGMTGATAHAFLAPPTRGIVLETFGAGNASQRPDVLAAFKDACDGDVVIVAISQCFKGSVSGDYETGQTLIQAGVVPGGDMTPECALTKLSYLLAKPELTAAEVRSLISLPLRGELTPPVPSLPAAPSSDDVNTDLSGLLSQFVRLSSSARKTDIPQIVIGEEAQDAAAPWSRTAAERASTEAALLPFLVHLAVARDDVEGLEFCLTSAGTTSCSGVTEGTAEVVVPGGIANCLDPGSGRSPLHVAALNGNMRCVEKLLKSGALVHLRDELGHTALYYAARQGHADIVDTLVSAGANLGGMENEAGYVGLAMQNAVHAGNEAMVDIWRQAGVKLVD